jgi:hypothetical protein
MAESTARRPRDPALGPKWLYKQLGCFRESLRSVRVQYKLWSSYQCGGLVADGMLNILLNEVPKVMEDYQAYHDMATHDAATGEGGLDASIQFIEELQRPEVDQISYFLIQAQLGHTECWRWLQQYLERS